MCGNTPPCSPPPPLLLPPLAPPPMHTYHNYWEERLPVMEGPQSYSKEHQVGEQECKWKPASDKSTAKKVISSFNAMLYSNQDH